MPAFYLRYAFMNR